MRRFAVVLCLTLFAMGSLPWAGALGDQSDPVKSDAAKDDYYELQKLLVDTLDQVERNYVEDVSRRQLVEAAIKGVLRELDPYSGYISPEDMNQFRDTVESQFGGIGIRISTENRQLRVLSPLVGTPAYKAGVLAGDRIVKINGESTKGFRIDDAVKRLKGMPGSDVTITVIHPGKSEEEEITLVRQMIHVNTVLGDHREADDSWSFVIDEGKRIGYIQLTAFSRGTAGELREQLARLKKRGIGGLILDLRFNPGGLLSSAIEVSDMFVPKGRIVSTEGRNTKTRTWDAKNGDTFTDFKMVVLVNRFSASASEIVSACLQDHGRAVVMGERTWGKGSVQNVIELEDGDSALKLTTAAYHRPSGKNINRLSDAKDDDEWGVTPNDGYRLRLNDKQMYDLLAFHRQRNIVNPKEPQSETVAQPDESAKSDGEQAGEPAEDRQPDAAPEAETPPEREESSRKSEKKPEDDAKGASDAESTVEPAEDAQPPRTPDESDDPEPEDAKDPYSADPQLRMAVDHLAEELAKAE
jgi:carboxyl-terminal processing protease